MLDRALIQKNKLRARLLLYGTPVVVLVAMLAVVHWGNSWMTRLDMSWVGKDLTDERSVILLQEYLRIDTTHATGSEIPGAEFLARQLEAAGIEAHVERLGRRNANLWAFLEGDDPRALTLLNHIDVEPIKDPGKWKHPPFEGVIELPFIYGRGTFDMKSLAIAQLEAMLRLKEKGAPLRRSLMFLATGDEEVDSSLGIRWWLDHHADLAARISAVLTEGGAVEAVSLEEVKFWGTEFGQKRFVDLWICDSDFDKLKALEAELRAQAEGMLRPPPPEVAEYLRLYGPSRDNSLFQAQLRSPETLHLRVDEFMSPRIMSLLRNELAVFPVEPSPEGGFVLRVIFHLLPDMTLEDGWQELIPDRLAGFTYMVDEQHGATPSSPLDHEIYRGIDAFMERRFPEAPHGPLFIPWSATDSRFFRVRGIPAYGYSPFWFLSGDASKMKGANERMPLPQLVQGVEVYADLVESLVAR